MANLPDLACRDATTIVQTFRYILTLQPTPCAVRRHVDPQNHRAPADEAVLFNVHTCGFPAKANALCRMQHQLITQAGEGRIFTDNRPLFRDAKLNYNRRLEL